MFLRNTSAEFAVKSFSFHAGILWDVNKEKTSKQTKPENMWDSLLSCEMAFHGRVFNTFGRED
jgi:hypothetical protein